MSKIITTFYSYCSKYYLQNLYSLIYLGVWEVFSLENSSQAILFSSNCWSFGFYKLLSKMLTQSSFWIGLLISLIFYDNKCIQEFLLWCLESLIRENFDQVSILLAFSNFPLDLQSPSLFHKNFHFHYMGQESNAYFISRRAFLEPIEKLLWIFDWLYLFL